MTLHELQIITTTLVTLYFITGTHRTILKAAGKKPWDSWKPFTCFFCMSFWLGLIVAIVSLFVNLVVYNNTGWEQALFFLGQNLVISLYLDKALGFTYEN